MPKTTSPAMKALILAEEAITLGPYQDGQHLSIGPGVNDPKLKPEDRITLDRAFELYAEALKPWEDRVNGLLKKEVSQGVFDALVSLGYNGGNRYLPAMAHFVNYEQWEVLDKLYPLCAFNSKGEWKEGIHDRRKRELKIMREGDYGKVPTSVKLWRGPPVGKPEMYTLQPGDIK